MHFFSFFFKKKETPVQTYKKESTKISYTLEEIATHFNISQQKIEEILLKLKWIDESKLPTQQGISSGAILKKDNTLVWDKSILSNERFISEVNNKINTLVLALSKNISTQNKYSKRYAYIA